MTVTPPLSDVVFTTGVFNLIMTEVRRSARARRMAVADVFEGTDLHRASAWIAGGHIVHVSTHVVVDGVRAPHSIALWFQRTLRVLVYMDINGDRYIENVPGQDWTAVHENIDTARQLAIHHVGADVPVVTLSSLNPTLHAEATRYVAARVAAGEVPRDGGCGHYVTYIVQQMGEVPRS